jgi:glycosyltransferase involved in cell wall biosynthesis
MLVRPLVTAVMPTANRRRFVPVAIACFQAQGYQPKELVILDDGDSVRDLIPDDGRIRYFHHTTRIVLGEKRNLGCELAAGEIICHWDDDDWSAPGRIEHQVAALQASGKPVTGFHSIVYFDEVQCRAWRYFGPPDFVVGSSLCYLKCIWAYDPFPRISLGEDNYMVLQARSRLQLCSTSGIERMISRRHSSNTSLFENHGRFCEELPVDRLKDIFGRGFSRATASAVAR